MTGVDFRARHPRFRAVADYLSARAPRGRLPGRQHIDPVDLKAHLAFINLIDVSHANGRPVFRYRVCGTAQVAATGRDATGKTPEESHHPAGAALVIAGMTAVLRTGQPDFVERALPLPDREHIRYQRVLFPLARDGATIDMLLVVHVYL